MNKSLIVVLLIVFIIVFSFGCRKKGVMEEAEIEELEMEEELEEELPTVVISEAETPKDTVEVNNYPGNNFPIAKYIYVECGGSICSVFERGFTYAKVLKIEGRTLTLDASNEQIIIDVPSEIRYTMTTYYVDPKTSKTISSVGPVDGDHFSEIHEQELIGVSYKVNQDKTLTVKSIGLVKVEEGLP